MPSARIDPPIALSDTGPLISIFQSDSLVMKVPMKSIHEPEADLLSAEDAIRDAERLRVFFPQRQRSEPAVPLWVLLEAIDGLELDALYQVSRRAGQRLEAVRQGI